ncbi:hypothetical protein N7501_004109 [Penicillium viridicatum]|nr:hypothetical protein N7501_004109 [Penicillium viridicatum]
MQGFTAVGSWLPTPLPKSITDRRGSKFSQRRYRSALLGPEQVNNYVTIKQATPADSLSQPEERRLRLWEQYRARDA